MGKHFGELAYIRGIVYYKISPHEQKPFAGAFSHGIPNFLTRTFPNIFYWLPPLLTGYIVYTTIEEAHYQNTRKDPRDFLHEVPPSE